MLEAAAVTQTMQKAGASCWQRAPVMKRSQLCKATGAADSRVHLGRPVDGLAPRRSLSCSAAAERSQGWSW